MRSDAMTTAAAQKTLAEAYPDRFLLGLGVSSPVLVQKVRGHSYLNPLQHMREYLEAMDAAPFNAIGPIHPPERVLGALGPKMLELSASHANGAHPYLTTPEHTRRAREILGSTPTLAPEQMVILESDPSTARSIGRSALSFYLRAPGYLANLKRLGYTDDDWADPKAASDRLVDDIVAWGGVDQIVRRVQDHFKAGASHVALQVLRGDGEIPIAEWRELAPALQYLRTRPPTVRNSEWARARLLLRTTIGTIRPIVSTGSANAPIHRDDGTSEVAARP